MATLLYQCPAGISGDMNLGAMVGLGVDPVQLEAELRKLPYEGWSLRFEPDTRQGISGIRCDVILEQSDTHSHSHGEGHHHHHTHAHHDHRSFSEIREAIEGSTLSDPVKTDAIQCFKVLAEAEGAVHGIEPEAVHFHEVGAIDSIIDMVGAAICWELLNVDRVVCNSLEVGGGMVQCAHGRMPVPAPATARLLEGKPYSSGATDKETTTPTGAALLAGKAAEFGSRTNGQQIQTAIGIGQRDEPNLANAVYVSLIDEGVTSKMEQDTVIELAANLDDMSAEDISYLFQQLLSAGALDVWQTPATFKKGRLGTIVHTLARTSDLSAIEDAYFKHSHTLGVRHTEWSRTKLTRTIQTIETPWGPVRLKQASNSQEISRSKFEHDDLARIAQNENQSLEWVREQLRAFIK